MDSLKIARIACLAVAGATIFATLLPPAISLLSNLNVNLHGLRSPYVDNPHLDPSPNTQIIKSIQDHDHFTPLQSTQRVFEISENLPDPKVGYAIAARIFQQMPITSIKIQDEEVSKYRKQVAQTVLQMVEKGSVNDEDNAFWPLCQAYAYASLGDNNNLKRAFIDAANCKTYNEYAWEASELDVKADPTPSNIERLRSESMILFPQLAQIKTASTLLVFNNPDDIDARVAVAKTGLLLAQNSKFAIESLVGIGFARTALLDTSQVRVENGFPAATYKAKTLPPESLKGFSNLGPEDQLALTNVKRLIDYQPEIHLDDVPSAALAAESVPERLITVPWLAALFSLGFVGAAVIVAKSRLALLPHLILGVAPTLALAFSGIQLDPLGVALGLVLIPSLSWLTRDNKFPVAPITYLGVAAILALAQLPIAALSLVATSGVWYLTFRLSNPRALAWISSVFSIFFAALTPVLPTFGPPPFDLQANILAVTWVGLCAGAIFTPVSPFRRNLIVALVASVALVQTVTAFTALSALEKACQNGLMQYRSEVGLVQSQVKTYLQSSPGDKSPSARVE